MVFFFLVFLLGPQCFGNTVLSNSHFAVIKLNSEKLHSILLNLNFAQQAFDSDSCCVPRLRSKSAEALMGARLVNKLNLILEKKN